MVPPLLYRMSASRNSEIAQALVLGAIRMTRTQQRMGGPGAASGPEAAALAVIAYAKKITARDLAAHQQVRAASMSRMIANLEARGLIARARDPEDTRLQWISVTPKGVKLAKAEHERRLKPLVAALAALPPRERATLEQAARLMDTVSRRIAQAR